MPKLYSLYGRGQAEFLVLPPPIAFENAPTSSQNNYAIGQVVYTGTSGSITFYVYAGAGVWNVLVSDQTGGTTAAMSGTPGSVVVSNSAVTASSNIIFSRKTAAGTLGNVSISAQSAGSFTLTSTANETSTFNYLIIN